MPATVTGCRACTLAPSAWLVISEFTTISVIGVLAARLLRDEARDHRELAERDAIGRLHPEAVERLGDAR